MLAMTFDETTKIFNGYVEIANAEDLPKNATLVKPVGIVQPYIWNGTAWTGELVSDFLQEVNTDETQKAEPSPEMQAINALGLQFAKLQAQVNGGAK